MSRCSRRFAVGMGLRERCGLPARHLGDCTVVTEDGEQWTAEALRGNLETVQSHYERRKP